MNRERSWTSGVLFLLGLAVFARTLNCGFVFDDDGYILQNPHVNTGLSLENLRWAFTTFAMANWHPLTWVSHQADVALWGLAPSGHHLTNVLLHGGSAVLLFLVLASFTGLRVPSAVAAALFSVHPLRVESVAWVSERKDVLSLLFLLVAFRVWRDQLERPSRARSGAALAAFAASLLAKPTGATFPALLLLVDWWPLGRWSASKPSGEAANGIRRAVPLIIEKLPFFIVAVASGVVTIAAQHGGGAVASFVELPAGARIANALLSVIAYLRQTIWPAGLSVFYPYSPGAVSPWLPALAALGIGSVTAFSIRRAHAHPWLAVGWHWYLLTLLPVIGLIQVGSQARADRYTYLPSIGLMIAAVWGCRAAEARRRLGSTLVALTIGLTFAAAGVTWHQIGYWRDGLSLFSRALALNPSNWLARGNYAAYLMKQGRWIEAELELKETLLVNPANPVARANLGVVLGKLGRPHEAVGQFTIALNADPSSFIGHLEFGKLLYEMQRFEEAQAHFARAVAISPRNADARVNLGAAHFQSGQWEPALASFREANRLSPAMFEAQYNVGAALSALGRSDEARPWFEKAARTRGSIPSSGGVVGHP